ncbi:non-homologous end-joining DNA ligase [Pseudonocardia sp. S2-4]|uniref:DNA ligase (ATP) n=2 Tax=Pseudonocardia humida TaxID=2800819 RepID=A0ABT0ZX19_9PSEU|nr:non-homologous end-joining DNA ligase [Pseudonocardia humida]
MMATAGEPPAGSGWAFEFKWDGVRAIIGTAGERIQLTSRNGNDVTLGYPELAGIGLGGGRRLLLDGELVALDPGGRPDFGLLQHRMHVRSPGPELQAAVPVQLYVFDLLEVDGTSLVREPHDTRRAQLLELGLDTAPGVAVPPSFADVTGGQLLEVARAHRLEGIVAKRRRSRYEPGRRSTTWIKTALMTTQEIVVGGWTPGGGRRASTLGALLLGAYDDGGALRFLGHVGTGFTDAVLHDLLDRLRPIERPRSPFDEDVPAEYARRARWAQPLLVGEVVYRSMTHDGRLRHAVWRGLRPDREPAEAQLPALP